MSILSIVIIAAVILLFLGLFVSIYNKLVTLKAKFENAFAQIEVQLTRRYDLIPNIVEVAKKYMQHENETLLKVIEARNGAVASLQEAAGHPDNPASIEALSRADNNLTGSLAGLRVQVEAYPELKANTVMLQLNEELTSTENRVAFARQAFNDAVTAYNIQRKSFPTNLVAATFGHPQDAALLAFENSKDIQAAPKISF